MLVFFNWKWCHRYTNVSAGIPIRTTLDNATTNLYATQVQQLATKARTTVRDLDPTNELSFLRVRTTKFEILIAPGEVSDVVFYT